MVTPKHIATFLMGAAVGAAIMRYNSMTKEEQEELMNKIKTLANDATDDAKKAFNQMQDYFTDLQGKGMEALKTQMGNSEQMVNDFISKLNPNNNETKK
jgi:gas vesicle protein